jgi:hypothetical protein
VNVKKTYWVIEHPTRGVHTGDGKFSWTILRSEGIHYATYREALTALQRIRVKGTYILQMDSDLGRALKKL